MDRRKFLGVLPLLGTAFFVPKVATKIVGLEKSGFCCKNMESSIQDGRIVFLTAKDYSPIVKIHEEFGKSIPPVGNEKDFCVHTNQAGLLQSMDFCMYCGKRLGLTYT